MSGTWSAGGNMPGASYAGIGGGDNSDGIYAGGSSSGAYSTICYEYNGSAWGSGGNLATEAGATFYGDAGSSANAIIAGGYLASISAVAQKYNGTAWSNTGSLGTARRHHSGGGGSSDAIVYAGLDTSWGQIYTCEEFGGTSWSAGTSINIQGSYVGGAGTSTDAMGAGYGEAIGSAQSYDGTAWTTQSSLNVPRNQMPCGGGSSEAVCYGGNAGTTKQTITERWTGSAWSSDGNLSTAVRQNKGGISGANSAISHSGYISGATANTEEYTWTPEVSRAVATNRIAAVNRIARIAPVIWNVTQLTTPTYDGSGQACHPSVVYIPGGFGGYKYWMGFTPYPNTNEAYENPCLLASNDGDTWVVPDGITNPLAATPPTYHNSDTELVYDSDNSILYLYYVEKTTGPVTKLWRFPITQGPLSVGTKVQCTISITNGFYSEAIVRNSSSDWVMWFIDDLYPKRVSSSDGLTWSDHVYQEMYMIGTGIRVKDTLYPWHPSVYKLPDGRYFFLMCSFPVGDTQQCDLYWAVSDGFDEPLDFQSTVLLANSSGWLSTLIYRSSLVQMENGQYRVYISAKGSTEWHIGYADIALW